MIKSICQNFENYSDFFIGYKNQIHLVEFGSRYPEYAKPYLHEYIQAINKYKNITPDKDYATFSLYQPPPSLKAGMRSLAFRIARRFEHIRVPAVATIGITKKCQCTCQHCSANYHMESKLEEMSDSLMIQAIKETVELGATNIIMVGGEPLLRKNLDTIIQSVDKEKSIVTIFTNGEFLTKDKATCLKDAGLFGVFFSLDSNLEVEHNEFRKRNDLFNKLRQGIDNANSAGLAIAISSYLTSYNLRKGHLDNIMELAKEWNVDEVTFFDAIPVGRMSNGKSTFLEHEDRVQINEATKKYRSLKDYPGLSPQSTLTSNMGSSFCFAANTQLYLSATGEMTPCDFTPLTVGKYPDQSIQTLWEKMINSPLYRRRSRTCRMQDPEFRKKTIYQIPENSTLPYPIENLPVTNHSAKESI